MMAMDHQLFVYIYMHSGDHIHRLYTAKMCLYRRALKEICFVIL